MSQQIKHGLCMGHGHGSVYPDFDYFSVLSIHSPSLNNVRKFDDILYSECTAAKPRVGTVHLATSDIDKL